MNLERTRFGSVRIDFVGGSYFGGVLFLRSTFMNNAGSGHGRGGALEVVPPHPRFGLHAFEPLCIVFQDFPQGLSEDPLPVGVTH